MHAGGVGVAAGFEVGERGEGLVDQRRVGRVGAELFADNVAHLPAHAGDEDKAADILTAFGGGRHHEGAFGMAEQPDTFAAGPLDDGVDPGAVIAGIDIDGNGVGVACSSAAEHTALVDTYGGDALLGQSFSEQLVGAGSDAHRAVSVAVSRTGAGNDQDHRRLVAGRKQRALKCAGADFHRNQGRSVDIRFQYVRNCGDPCTKRRDRADRSSDAPVLFPRGFGGFFSFGIVESRQCAAGNGLRPYGRSKRCGARR